MTTSTATASIPFAAEEAARKAAAAKTQATWNARVAAGAVDPDAWKIKMAATRAANKARREAEAAALEAEKAERIANLPTLRARACIDKARAADKAALAEAEARATVERLNRMREAARLVHLHGIRADGSINRNPKSRKPHLMVTRENADSIIARSARLGR